MSFTKDLSLRAQKLLIITSSGGGGLLQAAVAKEQEEVLKNPHTHIVKRDVLKDWVGKRLGNFSIVVYNKAQQKGDVKSITFLCGSQWIFDLMCWPLVFWNTLKILFRENIDRVIDTQNLCTSAIVKAIRFFNYRKSKNILLEKIIVDLPTNKASHFFKPIKKLSKKDKKAIQLKTIPPLLEGKQTLEDFWQKNCGLSNQDIGYEDLNVRQSFKKLQGKPKEPVLQKIGLRFESERQLDSMMRILQKSPLSYSVHGSTLEVHVPACAFVFTVLLGSQPANTASVGYVRAGIQLAREYSKQLFCLCVFSGEFSEKPHSLSQRIEQLVSEIADYPSNLSIVSFSFQNDAAIASLFHRSDLTCSRSGGQTAMELMAVSTGTIWVHSEAKGPNPTHAELLKGIPNWESESAVYLQRLRGAHIVTPETCLAFARELLRNKKPY